MLVDTANGKTSAVKIVGEVLSAKGRSRSMSWALQMKIVYAASLEPTILRISWCSFFC